MSRTDLEIAQDALDHLSVLRSHLTRGDLSDQTVADAVSLRLAAAIEARAYSVQALQARIPLPRMRFAGLRFGNLNTPEDLRLAGYADD